MAATEGIDDLLTRIGAKRMDLHAERLAQSDEPLEEFGRLQRLDDRRHLHLDDAGEPERRPFPRSEVRQGEDCAGLARAAVGLDGRDPVVGEAAVEFVDADVRQAERLDVVAAVPLERLGDLPFLLDVAKRAAIDAFEVAAYDRAGVAGHQARSEPTGARDTRGNAVRDGAGQKGTGLVGRNASHGSGRDAQPLRASRRSRMR